MPHDRIKLILLQDLNRLAVEGRRKGKETVVTGVLPASGVRGPRFLVEGEGEKPFLRMNSNGYLGLSLRPEIVAAEHDAVRRFGTGPGAVRFISGTWGPHLELERAVARFHGREAAMLFSSAYATVMGVLPPLITGNTAVISDELNHNSIINAIRLARPRERYVYRHLDLAELVCWGAIGARTTESQTHRQMASGLSMPLGFKNGTDGSIQTAINAIKAAGQPQTFLGINLNGASSAIVTRGNPNCHVVLRGGGGGPNYSPEHIARTEELLGKAGLPKSILVDCSHDNSAKKPELQPEVMRQLLAQITAGNRSIMGAMVESNLAAGSQPFPQPKANLRYGVSITDGCIDWATTETMVREIHATLAPLFR